MFINKFGQSREPRKEGISENYINEKFLRRDGVNTATGPLNMDDNRISNVIDPIDDQDAVTKGYVDSRTHRIKKKVLLLDGSTKPKENISWNDHKITNLGDPNADQDAATKSYVDFAAQSTSTLAQKKVLLLDGSTKPTQDISWNDHKIINLADPTVNQDAATKGYVDSRKPIVMFWVQEHVSRPDTWSDCANHGFPMLTSGRIIRIGVTTKKQADEFEIKLLIEGIEKFKFRKPPGMVTMARKLEIQVSSGDLITFSKPEKTKEGCVTVVAYIEIDL